MEARGGLLPWRALAMLAGAWFLVLLVATPSQGAETREEAVAAAREGRTGEAITALRKLLAEGTKDPLVGYDLALILTWVNRPREATDALERATAGGGEVPEYVLAPMVRAYRDQKRFAEAEQWAREGQRRYPMDSTWAKLLALVLADQKRGKEATELLKPWAATQPDDPEIWLALGYAAQRSGDRVGTLRAYGQALRLRPNNREAAAAIADVQAYDSWQLLSEFRYHYESGTPQQEAGGKSPGKELDFTTWLYSRPIAERWRLLGVYEFHQAEVTEGTALRFRQGAGLEWRLPDFTVEGIFWYNEGSLQRPGGSVAARWAPTDHWTFRGAGEIFAADTPLRAVINGVTADRLGGSMQYTWDDSRSLALGVQWYDFSDANQREAATLTFAQKIVNIPDLNLTLRPELYTSHNDTNNVPYYSPLRDFSGSVAFDAEHILWREYERSFGHRLVVTAGSYWQQDFGSGFIGRILYEQFYARNPWAEIRYGVQLNRNIYDGDAVPSVDFFIRGNFRF
jgi:Flp pilus assembly protein TadD